MADYKDSGFEDEPEASNPEAAGDFYSSLSKTHTGAGRPTKATHLTSHGGTAYGQAHPVVTNGWAEHLDLSAWQPHTHSDSLDVCAKSTKNFVQSASPHSDSNLKNPGNERYLGSGKCCSHPGCTKAGCNQ